MDLNFSLKQYPSQILDYYMTNLPTLDLGKYLSYHNSSLKYVLLFLGLIVWIIIPITSIFPILLFIHFNFNSNTNKINELNLAILILIAVTTAIFKSYQNIIYHTVFYVTDYGDLGRCRLFELAYSQDVELIFLLLSYPIYIISNGSEYYFLFCWSLFIKLATIHRAIKVSRENFALILFYTIANPAFFLKNFLGFCIFFIIRERENDIILRRIQAQSGTSSKGQGLSNEELSVPDG